LTYLSIAHLAPPFLKRLASPVLQVHMSRMSVAGAVVASTWAGAQPCENRSVMPALLGCGAERGFARLRTIASVGAQDVPAGTSLCGPHARAGWCAAGPDEGIRRGRSGPAA
jgi:hypothetical protein